MRMLRRKEENPVDENGLGHGEWLYYNNNQLEYRWNYVHGVRHGFQESYYSDGRLDYRGYLNMGQKTGYWFLDKEYKYYLCLI